MRKIILIFIVVLCVVFLGTHFINRYNAEKKIDQYIEDYGLSKEDMSLEQYPLFNSLNSTPGYAKVIIMKDDKQNSYVFEYDKDHDKVIFSANVAGNGEVSFGDELMKELKHQPSEKILP